MIDPHIHRKVGAVAWSVQTPRALPDGNREARRSLDLIAIRAAGLEDRSRRRYARAAASSTMSAVARQVSGEPLPVLDVFRLRCQARADLVAGSLMNFHDAIDGLHVAAIRYGLVTEVGQDGVQAIMAEAFANVPRARELEDSLVEQTPALDGFLVEVLSECSKRIVAASTLAAVEYLVKQK